MLNYNLNHKSIDIIIYIILNIVNFQRTLVFINDENSYLLIKFNNNKKTVGGCGSHFEHLTVKIYII